MEPKGLFWLFRVVRDKASGFGVSTLTLAPGRQGSTFRAYDLGYKGF